MVQVQSVIINCAGDGDLARDLYNSLVSKLGAAGILLVEDEIEVDGSTKKEIRNILDLYIGSDEKLEKHSILEFDNTFTVGIFIEPHKVGMITCEFCAYYTPYEEEMRSHKFTHYAGAPI
jgi:hypothetical protein